MNPLETQQGEESQSTPQPELTPPLESSVSGHQQCAEEESEDEKRPGGATNVFIIKKVDKLEAHSLHGAEKEEGTTESQIRELGLLEASQPLPIRAPEFPHADVDLSRWAAELRERRMLLLVSYDPSSLYSAAQGIASLDTYHRLYLLSFEPGLQTHKMVPVNPFLPARQGESPALVVAFATESTSASFLDAVIKSPASVDLMRKSLHEGDRLLLVLTNDRTLGWSEDPQGLQAQRAHVPCVRIPFLGPRLRRDFPDSWEELYLEICRQREAGRWNQNEEIFFKEITTYLGQRLLLKEIEERRSGRPTETVAAERLLSPRIPLESSVLFVATFFPGLPTRDFERLLLSFLGDRVQSTKTSAFVLSPDGEGRTEEITESRPLREVWSETYPEVLQRCHLHTRKVEARPDGSSGAPVVDFAAPELREELRSAFLGLHAPIFLAHLRLVRAARLLFDDNPEVADAAVRLAVETASTFPQELFGPGLGGWLPESGVELPRCYPFLRALLQRPALRELANRFFQEVFSSRRYGDLIDLVWRLRDVADFDALFWFRRLCDEGQEEARLKVSGKLRQAVRSGNAAEVLQGVYRWLPEPGAPIASSSAAIALSFFIDVSEDLLFEAFRRRRSGSLAHPLLMAAARDGGENLAKLSILWLLHPAAAATLRNQAGRYFGMWVYFWLVPLALRSLVFEEDPPEDFLSELGNRWAEVESDPVAGGPQVLHALLLPAFVLADWAVELLREEAATDRALWDRVLSALVQECDLHQRNILEMLWVAVEESLLDLLVFMERSTLSGGDDKERESLHQDLQIRMRCVRQLRLDVQTRAWEAMNR